MWKQIIPVTLQQIKGEEIICRTHMLILPNIDESHDSTDESKNCLKFSLSQKIITFLLSYAVVWRTSYSVIFFKLRVFFCIKKKFSPFFLLPKRFYIR